MNKNSAVFAVEPLPKALDYLRQNIELNGFAVDIVPMALSDFTGDASVYIEADKDFSNSVTVNRSLLDEATPQRSIPVKTITMKDLIERRGLKKIDLMKIDVETHEPEVLAGMAQYLAEFRPTFIIEVLNDDVGMRLTGLLSQMGYLYFNIDDAKDTVRRTDSIVKSDYWNYLVCQRSVAKRLNLA